MSALLPALRPNSRLRKQRGAALMVMLVLLVLGTVTFLVNALSSTGLQIERDKITADALAKAKEALIGYSTNSNTPGKLPCPEQTSLIGTPTEGSADGSCSNTLPTIGRLPWRSLGIGPIRDSNGELLWYVLSPGFRNSPINSNTQAQLTVNGITNRAVAIIFSAGAPINGQIRPTPTAGSPPDASQYLELSNNVVNSTTFVTSGPAATFNDRLLLVTHDDLFHVVEKRVAKELQNTFADYISNNPGTYPNPANISCSTAANCNYDASQCRGWIPVTANNNPTWVLPNWFSPNDWYRVIYYSASSSRLASTPPGCNLTVSGTATQALFFMAGAPINAQVRPSNNLQDYLEDIENNNMDDIYLKPGATATSNDSLYALP